MYPVCNFVFLLRCQTTRCMSPISCTRDAAHWPEPGKTEMHKGYSVKVSVYSIALSAQPFWRFLTRIKHALALNILCVLQRTMLHTNSFTKCPIRLANKQGRMPSSIHTVNNQDSSSGVTVSPGQFWDLTSTVPLKTEWRGSYRNAWAYIVHSKYLRISISS